MRRGGLALLVLSAFLAGVWVAAELPAQDRAPAGKPRKPRVEEEEEPAKPDKKPAVGDKRGKPRTEEEEDPTAPRKVRRIDEDDIPDDTPGAASGDLRQAAEREKNPIVKTLFHSLAVPHDHVLYGRITHVVSERGQKEEDIEPYPEYAGEGPKTLSGPISKFRVLDTRDWKVVREHTPARETIASIQPYEEIAERRVKAFLEQKLSDYAQTDDRYLSRYQQLQKAEQVLSAVLRFHESARQRQARRGPGWDDVQSKLRRALLDVSLEELRSLQASQDWDGLYVLTRRLMGIYPLAEDRARIAVPLAEEINRVLTSGSPLISEERKRQALQRLHSLEEQVPGNAVVRGLGRRMQVKAQGFLDRAREHKKAHPDDLATVQALIRQAEEVCPDLPGLHSFKLELGESVLRVGVRQLPELLSPARAWTDNEVRVLEMLFEGLVKQCPDSSGLLRYRPGLAEELPRIVSLGREFQLPRNARWNEDRALDAGDVRFSVRQMRTCPLTGRWLAQGEMLEDVELRGHAHQVTLRLRHGFLDPLALMTFKIVPQNSKPDGEEFARRPLGSGPFVYAGRMSPAEEGHEYMSFRANPFYASRANKLGLPRLREIRLFTYNKALSDLRDLRLNLILDLTADEAADLAKEAGSLGMRVPLPGPTTPNRRVYFLAVNQRKPPLDNAKIRQALAYAINREALLDRHYRGKLKRSVHKALNGPFPARSWALDPKLVSPHDANSLDLYDQALAQARCKEVGDMLRTAGELTLKYPEDDLVLKEALTELAEQVRKSTNITLRLVPRNPHGLREDVELTQSYDLAYYHYDYPDETYWLRPLLGPNVPERGENYLGFRGGALEGFFDETRGRRYFPEVQKHMRLAHKPLLEEMPLIPLWQLDPLVAVHEQVQAPPFDPQLVFTDAELWRLKKEK
jgi:ABC-type oligopeptide transport system substrate-binding subunit